MSKKFMENMEISEIGVQYVYQRLTQDEKRRIDLGEGRENWNIRKTEFGEEDNWQERQVDILETWTENGEEREVWHEVKTDEQILQRPNGYGKHWEQNNYAFLVDQEPDSNGTGNLYIEEIQSKHSIGWYEVLKEHRPDKPPRIRYLWYLMSAKPRRYIYWWGDTDETDGFMEYPNNIVLKIDDRELIRVYDENKNKYTPVNSGKGRIMPLSEVWREPKGLIRDKDVIPMIIPTDPSTGTTAVLYVDYERNYERLIPLTRDINGNLTREIP